MYVNYLEQSRQVFDTLPNLNKFPISESEINKNCSFFLDRLDDAEKSLLFFVSQLSARFEKRIKSFDEAAGLFRVLKKYYFLSYILLRNQAQREEGIMEIIGNKFKQIYGGNLKRVLYAALFCFNLQKKKQFLGWKNQFRKIIHYHAN